MTDEINDYAPPLLGIKATIKLLEELLPAGKWDNANEIAWLLNEHIDELRECISHHLNIPA